MSRQTRALHKPGKAAADSAHAPLPPGSIRQMRDALRAREGKPREDYGKGISVVSPVLIEVIATLPEAFTFDTLRHHARLEFMNTNRLRQQTGLLKRAGLLALSRRGTHGIPSRYRRTPAFDAAQAVDGPPLTAVEIAYREFRASLKGGVEAPAETIGDVLVHPSQR